MKTHGFFLSALAAAFLLAVGTAFAADAAAAAAAPAADPTGNWKWSFTPPNGGQAFESTAKLVLKDGQLTGSVTGRAGETAISDGSFKDGVVAFTIVREREGQKFTVKYSGKLDGDAIKGNFEFSGFGGDPLKLDWTATRVK